MTVITLMLGILIAAPVFLAFFWSTAQALRVKGALRVAHIAVILAVLAAMTVLQFAAAHLAVVAGAVLILAGGAAALLESGWSRVLPLFPALLGVALILGLPFAGG